MARAAVIWFDTQVNEFKVKNCTSGSDASIKADALIASGFPVQILTKNQFIQEHSFNH